MWGMEAGAQLGRGGDTASTHTVMRRVVQQPDPAIARAPGQYMKLGSCGSMRGRQDTKRMITRMGLFPEHRIYRFALTDLGRWSYTLDICVRTRRLSGLQRKLRHR
jgi:hypothetical protein